MSHEYDRYPSQIEILELHEAVRRHPSMFLGTANYQDALLRYTVRDILHHYACLEQRLEAITIKLEGDGSAKLTSQGGDVSDRFLAENPRLFESPQYLTSSIVTAACETFSATMRGPNGQWRSLVFERGKRCSDEWHSVASPQACELWLHLCPDATLLGRGGFDVPHTSAALQDFIERHPTVAFAVRPAAV